MKRRAMDKRNFENKEKNLDYCISNTKNSMHVGRETAYKVLHELQKARKDKIQLKLITEKQ
jgi:hypothetical protein